MTCSCPPRSSTTKLSSTSPAKPAGVALDLASDARAGKIVEAAASAEDIARVLSKFDRSFRKQIDAGEAEALACLVTHAGDELRFVTSDASAVQAVAMLGLSERAMCLADALRLCGLSRALPRQHEAAFLREHIRIGEQRFVTREGLA